MNGNPLSSENPYAHATVSGAQVFKGETAEYLWSQLSLVGAQLKLKAVTKTNKRNCSVGEILPSLHSSRFHVFLLGWRGFRLRFHRFSVDKDLWSTTICTLLATLGDRGNILAILECGRDAICLDTLLVF